MKFLKQKYTKTENLMLINMLYNKKRNKKEDDSIDIIYKDLSTGKKYLEHIKNPPMEIFFTKPEYRTYDYGKYVMPLEQVEPFKTTTNRVLFDIANNAGGAYAEYLRNCVLTKNRNALKNLHKYKYVMASDYDPEAYYRIQWGLEYNNDKIKKITKLYSDIEVDGIGIEGFVDGGIAPINAIALIDEESKTCYSFLLRNEKNPLISEFEENIEEVKKECDELFTEFYGKWEYKILMYDEKDEIKMIRDYFSLVHALKRDFIMFWNMKFDANYFIDRIKVLGYNPEDIMCHPDFPVKKCYYYEDKLHFAIKQKKDWFTLSDYTVWVDQMILYGQVRKGQSELGSLSLNIVGQKEIGEAKIDYSEEANIKTLPYVDYKKFYIYNLKDSLLQYGIERRTSDLETLYIASIENFTPYRQCFSETRILRNLAYVDYYKQGYIIGNNLNVDYNKSWDDKDDDNDEEDEKFSGALVGDPRLNTNKNGMVIMGRLNKYLRKYVVDFDFSSLYPSIKILHNIGPHTLVGKISFEEKVYDRYTAYEMGDRRSNKKEDKKDKYDSGKEFIENMLCDNPIMTGVRWFNLPNTTEVLEKFALQFDLDRENLVPEPNIYRRKDKEAV